MRIGVDARKLRDGGIGTYIRQLIKNLRKLPGDQSIVAFLYPRDLGVLAPIDPGASGSRSFEQAPVHAGRYSIDEHFELARAAGRAAVDLFHAPHYTLPLAWRGPSVVTIHDLTHVRHGSMFRPGTALYARAVAGLAVRRASLVIADSRHAKSEIVELLKVPEPKVRVVPLGVSEAFRRRASDQVSSFLHDRGLPAGYLLYVGARRRHKNLPLLLQALAQVAPESRPPLVVSGEPWSGNDPHARLSERLGLASTVHFAGNPKDDHELSCLYSAASLYVHPSLAEGFGLPPLEAMACGTPVLASRSGALPEVLGDAAELLDASDVEAWSDRITGLLADRARRDELTRRGLKHVLAFKWERTAAQTLELYREVIAGITPAGRP